MSNTLLVIRRSAIAAVLVSARRHAARAARPPAYVSRISVDPVPDDGSVDGMNRAMILVVLTGAPDPGSDPHLATFAAAYGPDRPR